MSQLAPNAIYIQNRRHPEPVPERTLINVANDLTDPYRIYKGRGQVVAAWPGNPPASLYANALSASSQSMGGAPTSKPAGESAPEHPRRGPKRVAPPTPARGGAPRRRARLLVSYQPAAIQWVTWGPEDAITLRTRRFLPRLPRGLRGELKSRRPLRSAGTLWGLWMAGRWPPFVQILPGACPNR